MFTLRHARGVWAKMSKSDKIAIFAYKVSRETVPETQPDKKHWPNLVPSDSLGQNPKS